ncbi:MAG: type II toxin-antitoxin system VapC family toxin [Deltaproteobacteria bacterium]|nr:type II toxin-antitoxin system VapC family toxin [Deltaproteobacteria bacterium]
MNVLIDSTIWIEFLTNGPKVKRFAKYLRSPYKIILPSIVSYEVYKKIKSGRGEGSAILIMAQIERLSHLQIPLTQELAVRAADVSLQHKIPMADAIIYTTSQDTSALLVTMDAHFKNLPDVEFISPGGRLN